MSKLYLFDVCSLRPFWSLLLLEANSVTLLKDFVSFAADCREVYKQVRSSVIRSNESVTLGFIEPLYCSLSHKITTFPSQIKNHESPEE